MTPPSVFVFKVQPDVFRLEIVRLVVEALLAVIAVEEAKGMVIAPVSGAVKSDVPL